MKNEKTALGGIITKAEKEEKSGRQQKMTVDAPSETKQIISVSESEIQQVKKMLDERLTIDQIIKRGFTLTILKFCIEEINNRFLYQLDCYKYHQTHF